MKPTADQVIEEFRALSPDEKRRVYVTIVQQGSGILKIEINESEKSEKDIEKLLDAVPVDGQKLLWKGIPIDFIPNLYVSNYTEIWLLESILGSSTVRDTLRESYILDANFVEQLFRQFPYSFYLNQAETWLFADYGDLSEAEGGPLKQLTAFDALQRYGLKLLEEAKEKQYVRL